MKNLILFVALSIITVVLSVMSWHYFGSDDAGILLRKPEEVKSWLPFVLRIHIGGGMLAMACGAFLVLSSKRAGLIKWHRWLGRLYTVAVFLSGLAGAIIAPHAIGGIISALGLGSLSLAWMYSTGLAAHSAIKGDWATHHKSTTYSLALTFSSLTFRLVLLFAFLGIPFVSVYRTSCWVSWILHLGFAAWWLYRQQPSFHYSTKTTVA